MVPTHLTLKSSLMFMICQYPLRPPDCGLANHNLPCGRVAPMWALWPLHPCGRFAPMGASRRCAMGASLPSPMGFAPIRCLAPSLPCPPWALRSHGRDNSRVTSADSKARSGGAGWAIDICSRGEATESRKLPRPRHHSAPSPTPHLTQHEMPHGDGE